jgi:L-amino acid N-acyltransferase YncA
VAFALDLRPHPAPGGPLAWARVPWDSDALGLEVFELRCEGEADAVAGALPSLLADLDARGAHLAVARVPIGATALARVLGAAGFSAVEASFELSLPLRRRASAPPVRFPAGLLLRDATPADEDAVAAIAREAFANDRYHLEPAVDPERASDRFEGWVRRAFADGDAVLVLVDDRDRTIGFFHVRPDAGGDVDLSLAAVAAQFRQAGVGPLLYAAVLDLLRERGHRTAHTRIAAQNLDVLNVYAHLGFAFTRSLICLHRPSGR